MSLTIYYTDEFLRCYRELPSAIQRKAERRELMFRENPHHPSLHTEKLHPKNREVLSFRIDDSYRVLFRFDGHNTVYFLAAGPHSGIYRML